jgi:hypothetical protein
LELTGKIVQVLPEKSGASARGQWRKQEYILEIPGDYPKQVCFMVWGDKIDQFGVQQGQNVTVSIDLKSASTTDAGTPTSRPGGWFRRGRATRTMAASSRRRTMIACRRSDKPDPSMAMRLLIRQVRDAIPFDLPEARICTGLCNGCSVKLLD